MPKIYNTRIWDSQKNFGGAINDFCRIVPDDAWVMVTDGDMCFLTDAWGSHLEEVIRLHGDEYQLLGCMTNRVGVTDQLLDGSFDNNFDMRILSDVSAMQETFHYTEVKEAPLIAGLLMLFPKKLWKQVGGFDENTKHFDSLFCQKVHKSGGKIGIMEGLYVYHNYRIDCEKREVAIMQSNHLGKR